MDIVVGTAGHIDHGKTALVKALTGTDTDRLPEEKKRGITIDLGFAEMEHRGVHFGFVDVPGHERFVKNMLAGASGIDLVLLVVAADEGVMPQTREHFEICRLLGVRTGIVAVTKSDLADPETMYIVIAEIAELVAGSFLENVDVVRVSARSGSGIDDLKNALANAAKNVPLRSDRLVSRLPVDRVFTKKGFGTVVTGTLASGTPSEGNELDLLPEGRVVRVRSIQTHGRAVKKAVPGNRTAINLAGIDHTHVTRGMTLAEKGVLRPTLAFDAEVEVLRDTAHPLRSRQRVRVHIGSAEVLARLAILNEAGEVAPGRKGYVQFRLESPVTAVYGDRFVVRSYSPQATIAGGIVLDNFPERHKKRGFAETIIFLKNLVRAAEDPDQLLADLVSSSGPKGLEIADVRARTGWNEELLKASIAANEGRVMAFEGILISNTAFAAVKEMIRKRIEAFHKREPLAAGLNLETLRKSALISVPAAVVQNAIAELAKEKLIAVDGDIVRVSKREQQLSPEEAAAKARFAKILSEAKLEPPKIGEIMAGVASLAHAKARQVFQLLLDEGSARKVTDEFYFFTNSLRDLETRLKDFASRSADRTIDVAQFKELAGVSRKYAIPLLEYFDREKVTVRSGDKRIIL